MTGPLMQPYHDLVREALAHGTPKADRTGTGTRTLFARQLRFDLTRGFPLLTTKRVHWRSVREELLWFLSGSTNVKDLQARGVTIWDEWADGDGYLGPIYGAQWRRWRSYDAGVYSGYFGSHVGEDHLDQIYTVQKQLRQDNTSRRIVISAWNVEALPSMALPPCHLLSQFVVIDGKLNCAMTMRSGDIFLGVPFNIASYALLTHMFAHVTGHKVGELVVTINDAHLYNNHVEQAELLLTRTHRLPPRLVLDPGVKDIDDFTSDSIELFDYNPHPSIPAPVAV